MLIMIVPLTVLLLVMGWLFLVAGGQSGPAPESSGPDRPDAGLPGGRLASRMTDGLDRTARAVDVLVERRPGEVPLAARSRDPQQRRATYVVVGGGLVGLAVLLAVGLALVVSG